MFAPPQPLQPPSHLRALADDNSPQRRCAQQRAHTDWRDARAFTQHDALQHGQRTQRAQRGISHTGRQHDRLQRAQRGQAGHAYVGQQRAPLQRWRGGEAA